MVFRVFRVRVHPGKEDEFECFVIETGIPMAEAQEGCTHMTAGKSRWSESPSSSSSPTGGLLTLYRPSRVRIGKKR